MSRLSLGRVAEALAFIARVRISDCRFRWHRRRQERHDARAVRHLEAMAAEMQRNGKSRADIYGRMPRHYVMKW